MSSYADFFADIPPSNTVAVPISSRLIHFKKSKAISLFFEYLEIPRTLPPSIGLSPGTIDHPIFPLIFESGPTNPLT